MDLIDLQGRIWTANEWDLLRNGVEAENGRVAVFETKANTVEEPVETSALDTKQGFESRAWETTMSSRGGSRPPRLFWLRRTAVR